MSSYSELTKHLNGLYYILQSYNRVNNRLFCTCGKYKDININTHEVLAVLRLDLFTLIKMKSILLSKSADFMAQLYFDCRYVNKVLLQTNRQNPWNSTDTLNTNNYINFTNNQIQNYWAYGCIICNNKCIPCVNLGKDLYNIEIKSDNFDGVVRKFLDIFPII